MIIKGLLAASLALGTTAPAYATSSTFYGHHRYSTGELISRGIHPTIAQGFEDLNVPVVDGATLPQVCGDDGSGGTTLAMYNYKYNIVFLCTQHIPNGDAFITAATHEAVHLVQDCRSGILTADLSEAPSEYLNRYFQDLSLKHRKVITDYYERSSWNVEIEAYYFQSRPAAVADGIKRFCF